MLESLFLTDKKICFGKRFINFGSVLRKSTNTFKQIARAFWRIVIKCIIILYKKLMKLMINFQDESIINVIKFNYNEPN